MKQWREPFHKGAPRRAAGQATAVRVNVPAAATPAAHPRNARKTEWKKEKETQYLWLCGYLANSKQRTQDREGERERRISTCGFIFTLLKVDKHKAEEKGKKLGTRGLVLTLPTVTTSRGLTKGKEEEN